MKCPYPDCTGQVTEGEQFCGECGRALTWQNGQPMTVLASSSGAPGETGPTGPMPIPPPPPMSEPPAYTPLNTYTPVPSPPVSSSGYGTPADTAGYSSAAPPPGYTPPADKGAYTPPPPPPPLYTPSSEQPTTAYPAAAAPPPGYTPPPPTGYAPPPAMPPTAAAPPARKGPNPIVLILVGGVGGLLLLCLACFGLSIVGAILAPSTPTSVPIPTRVVRIPTATTRPIARATATVQAPATVVALATDTAVPEDTPVAEETPVELPTADASATAEASDFDIDFTDYQNSSGADVVVGTIHNKGTERLENVKVTAELLDNSGAVVGSGDDVFLPLAIMEGNQTLPFQVTISEGGDTAERIHVSVNADVYDSTGFRLFEGAQGLTVEGATLADGILGPTLSGQVKNGGAKGATLVHVVAVAYDDNGEIVDTGTGYVTNDIDAGGSADFELFFLRPDVKVAKYEATAIGQEK